MPRRRKTRPPSDVISRQVVRETFRSAPWLVAQGTSGTGGLSTLNSGVSSSNVSEVELDPLHIGGRFNTVAQTWLKYRIRKVRVTYEPTFETSSGVTEVVTGTTTAPNYQSRAFCWAINEDPAFVIPSSGALLESGGKAGNTSKRSSFVHVFRDPRWYYTSNTLGSPTAIDRRFTCPGELMFRFVSASTTNAVNFGHVILDYIGEFTGPVIATSLLLNDEKTVSAAVQKPGAQASTPSSPSHVSVKFADWGLVDQSIWTNCPGLCAKCGRACHREDVPTVELKG